MESYIKLVEELPTYGDIGELPRYFKKMATLDSKLDQAMERIDGFNAEERAFGFNETSYPSLKIVSL